MDLNALKLPVLKNNIDMLYRALSHFRKSGEWAMSGEDMVNAQSGLKVKLDACKGDVIKQTNLLLSQADSEKLARIRAFNDHEADLDILIAKMQVLRRKFEKEVDAFIVDDLLAEIMGEK